MDNFNLSILEKQILAFPKTLLLTHQDPDEDAIGSLLSLNEIIQKWGAKTTICLSGKINSHLKIEQRIFSPQEIKVSDFPTIIITDTSNPSRTGLHLSITETFPKNSFFIIDHHIFKKNISFSPSFKTIIRPRATASCEIIFDLIKEKKEEINSKIAYYLLTGIYSDSGGFSHSNTTPALLKKSNELFKKGIIFRNIIQSTFRGKKIKTLNFWGEKINSSFFHPQLKFISAWITQQETNQNKISSDEISGLVNLLNMCEEAKFSLFLREVEDGQIKGSLRSSEKKKSDVNLLSRFLGGGGHRLAAGFEVNGKIVEKGSKICVKTL